MNLPGDACERDPIWDREVETEDRAHALARGEAAWERQWAHLMQHSDFYRGKFAGSGPVRLADLHRLPFTTKSDLKAAIDERPPFGTNLCVPEERVKRVYQTSGTSGAPLRWLDTAESWNWLLGNWEQVLRVAGVTRSDRVLCAFSFQR